MLSLPLFYSAYYLLIIGYILLLVAVILLVRSKHSAPPPTRKEKQVPIVTQAELPIKGADLIHYYPFPACLIDKQGVILATNKTFLSSITRHPVVSLQDIDTTFGTALSADLIRKKQKHCTFAFKQEDGGKDGWRHFGVLTWPLAIPGQEFGTVISFHEQTHVQRRKSSQTNFEQELITYLGEISQYLENTTNSAERLSQPALQRSMVDVHLLAKEMNLLARYLSQIHTQVRQLRPYTSVNVPALIHGVVGEYRSFARQKQVQFITTLPKTVWVAGHKEDIELSLRALVEALLFLTEPNHQIRLNISQIGKTVTVECVQADKYFPPSQLEKMLKFSQPLQGAVSDNSLWRVQLLIVREIANKFNGSFAVESFKEAGTIYSLTFSAGKPE